MLKFNIVRRYKYCCMGHIFVSRKIQGSNFGPTFDHCKSNENGIDVFEFWNSISTIYSPWLHLFFNIQSIKWIIFGPRTVLFFFYSYLFLREC